ncbi:hypothetical protein MKY96_33050 [Paenibacillus sp. FSL R7-0302]|uniref:hypothetical protein n=1 Tax=Paenibacillus sp. FSL R7-0302 TaxID=2921681 RepID=UPI0030FB3B30
MEYLIALLVVALIAVLYFKNSSKVYKVIVGTLIEALKNKEAEIVYGLYNKLPQSIKDKVDSRMIAEIVGFTIGVVADILSDKAAKLTE